MRGYLFQGRVGSWVLDEKELVAAVRYVGERNPVRAGIVSKAWDNPWSSERYHVGQREIDIVVKNRGLCRFVGDWKEYVGGEDGEEEKDLRRATRMGRPCVDGNDLAMVERKTTRDLRKGKPGRPRKDIEKK